MLDITAVFTNYTGAFPDIEAINVTAPGAGDGTEFIAALINDGIWGPQQALMDYAGLVPDGVTEAPDTAQVLSAIARGYGIGPGVGVIYWKNDTPAAFGDRVLLFTGQEILQATYQRLFNAVYCGDADNATAPAFYSTNGAGVRTTPGAGGTHFVLPDTRGLSLKNIGDATISGRVKTGPVSLGSVQEDGMQRITGAYNGKQVQTASPAQIRSGALDYGDAGAALEGTTGAAGTQNGFKFDSGNSPNARISENGTTATSYTRDSTIGTRFGITY